MSRTRGARTSARSAACGAGGAPRAGSPSRSTTGPIEAATQAERVVRRAAPGAIVDLHDAEGTPNAPERLLEALPPMIAGLRERGYSFATVSDLLARP